jgi:hypothetical protein
MPVFTFPLAFLGLLAIPVLIAIYWLRSRAREHQVSSLLLWLDERQMWEGGQQIHRLQTPLLFFLELLAIILLVTSAAGPMRRAGDTGVPLVIVLDDSFSMLAGGAESVKNRAAKAIENELRANRYDPVRFLLAGESPQLLGEAVTGVDQAMKYLDEWRCSAQTSKLDEAIVFAFELGGSRARVLAITDHKPEQELNDSRLQWWAFGSSRPNAAFVNATRTTRDNEDRVLLEIANLSTSSNPTTLTIESNGQSEINNQQSATRDTQRGVQSISLGPNETRRLVFALPVGAPPLIARLSDDALNVDNEIVLAPEGKKLVRTHLQVQDQTLRRLVEQALQSSQSVLLTTDKPDLLVTDGEELGSDRADAWTLKIISEKDAASYLGPFVIDRSHPLSEGLSLGGVVWGSGKGTQFPGTPIITAGNIPLLTDVERAGRHELRLRLRPDLSTLPETPNWPVFFWNLVDWRARATPGLQQSNVRLGSDTTLTVETGVDSVEITDPQRNVKPAPVRERVVTIKADMAGVYEINTGRNKYSFAANALRREESDLSQATSGRWGNWAKASELQWEYRSMAWVLLLLAMIVLAIHAWLVARNTKPG